MKTPEERLNELGFSLPPPIILPEGLHLPFSFVNIRGNRAFISGHPRQSIEGAIDGPYGKLGRDLTMDQGKAASREIALSVLSNLKKKIGELSRVTGWCRVFGIVNSTQGFDEQQLVINSFSDLIIEVFGQGIGNHARSAIGVSGLPMNFAIEIEGELEIN